MIGLLPISLQRNVNGVCILPNPSTTGSIPLKVNLFLKRTTAFFFFFADISFCTIYQLVDSYFSQRSKQSCSVFELRSLNSG